MVSRATGLSVIAVAVAAAAVVGGVANQVDANQRMKARVHALTGGDPDRGFAAVGRRACASCHQIPGVAGETTAVGPSLKGFSQRVYIGGRLRNTPDNLVLWIENPHAVDPQNAMPPQGIGEREARDIAAYLYTLH